MKKIFITFSVCCVVIFSGFFSYKVCRKCYFDSNFSVAIYTVYHKPAPIYENDVVIPIQAGRALHTKQGRYLEDKMIGDDTGDNISIKNDRYSELTALYWMWKNAPKVDYIGMMHYRRHFINPFRNEDADGALEKLGLTKDYLRKLLYNYDIIIPVKMQVKRSVYKFYCKYHYKEDLDMILDYVRYKYPEMKDDIDSVMNSKSGYFWNLFIMRYDIFQQYAAWLFEILEPYEDKLGPASYKHLSENAQGKSYQIRAQGFLAERLLHIWLYHNRHKYRIHELHIDREHI